MHGELGNVRLVIIFMGLTTLMLSGGGIWLAHNERPIPDFLIGLAGVAAGGLGAMLSKTSTNSPASPPHAPPPPADPGDPA